MSATENQYEILNVPTLSENVEESTSSEQIHLKPLQPYNRTNNKEARNRKSCINLFLGFVTFMSIVAAVVAIAGLVMSRKHAVLGQWSSWMPWTDCSKSCGIGLTYRRRNCSNATPSKSGIHCYGDSVEYNVCEVITCAITVNGHWSIWSPWVCCNVTCGLGTQSRTRTCNNPFPSHGGQTCSGSPIDFRQCGTLCGVNGGWSSWFFWNSCYVDAKALCGPGVRKRYRYCDNPYPSGQGRACMGNSVEVGSCIIPCTFSRGNIRITGGPSIGYGRLEVNHNGSWGTVCDDKWSSEAATVACKQLGFGDASALDSTFDIDRYGPGSGTIWLDDLDCHGDESYIWDCLHNGWGLHDCSHSEDVGINCNH